MTRSKSAGKVEYIEVIILDRAGNNLVSKGKSVSPIIIDGQKVYIIRYVLIQRDLNTSADDYQKLLNSVGEAYTQKRNEIARQYYQTGYNALDTEKKAIVDNVVPIMVMTTNDLKAEIAEIEKIKNSQ